MMKTRFSWTPKIRGLLSFFVLSGATLLLFQNMTSVTNLSPINLNTVAPPQMANPLTLADLVSDLKPTNVTKSLSMFSDGKFLSGQDKRACQANYSISGSQTAPIVDDPGTTTKNEISANFGSVNKWSLTSWVTEDKYPHLCSSESRTELINGSLQAKVIDRKESYSNSMAFHFGQNFVNISARTLDFWRAAFGVTIEQAPDGLYRTKSDLNVSWPNQFITYKFGNADSANALRDASTLKAGDKLIPLSLMKKFEMIFDAELMYKNINTFGVNIFNISLPTGSQLSYDDKTHATQFRIAYIIQYRLGLADLQTCNNAKKIGATEPSYCSYHGKIMHYVAYIFDERFEYTDKWTSSPFMVDLGTNAMMYRESLQNFMSAAEKNSYYQNNINPYKSVGSRFVLDSDILPLLKRAVFSTRDYSSLPPKRSGSGPDGLETDQEYLSHIAISSVGVGYEITGLTQIVFRIHQLKFNVEL